MRGGEEPQSGEGPCPLPDWGTQRESGVAQERGSGQSKKRLERVVANIGTVGGLCKKGKSVDTKVCASAALLRSQQFSPSQRLLFPPRERV